MSDWKKNVPKGQTKLAVEKRVVPNPEKVRVRKLAERAHEVYKLYKAGLIKSEELSPTMKSVLKKYFGVEEQGELKCQ